MLTPELIIDSITEVRFDRDGDGVAEDGWFDVSYQPARDFDGRFQVSRV